MYPIILKTQNISLGFTMKKLMVTGVQIPIPSRQQVGPFVHYDGFSSNNMRLNSSQFGTF
jgi:hypothetical protein